MNVDRQLWPARRSACVALTTQTGVTTRRKRHDYQQPLGAPLFASASPDNRRPMPELPRQMLRGRPRDGLPRSADGGRLAIASTTSPDLSACTLHHDGYTCGPPPCASVGSPPPSTSSPMPLGAAASAYPVAFGARIGAGLPFTSELTVPGANQPADRQFGANCLSLFIARCLGVLPSSRSRFLSDWESWLDGADR